MRLLIPILGALLAVAGCNQEAAAPVPKASATPAAAIAATAKTSVSASSGQARAVDESNGLYEFAYVYPAQAGGIPALKTWLDADLVKQRARLVADARQGRREAREGGFPYHLHSRSITWEVVADLPAWLSLSALVDAYAGGAHPNHWFDQMLWDKQAGKRRQPHELFTSKAALSRAIREPFCLEIDRQREERRGEKVDRSSDDPFSECLDPTDHAVILGSSNGAAFNRIGVLVPPYEAGPYVEGSYEVTLPVTAAVLAAVKPEFARSFSPVQ